MRRTRCDDSRYTALQTSKFCDSVSVGGLGCFSYGWVKNMTNFLKKKTFDKQSTIREQVL